MSLELLRKEISKLESLWYLNESSWALSNLGLKFP